MNKYFSVILIALFLLMAFISAISVKDSVDCENSVPGALHGLLIPEVCR